MLFLAAVIFSCVAINHRTASLCRDIETMNREIRETDAKIADLKSDINAYRSTKNIRDLARKAGFVEAAPGSWKTYSMPVSVSSGTDEGGAFTGIINKFMNNSQNDAGKV